MRGTVCARAEREGAGGNGRVGIGDATRRDWGWAARSAELRVPVQKATDAHLRSASGPLASADRLSPAGDRCFRVSCCLKSCGDCSIYMDSPSEQAAPSSLFSPGCVGGLLPLRYLQIPLLPRHSKGGPLPRGNPFTPVGWLVIALEGQNFPDATNAKLLRKFPRILWGGYCI